MHLPRRALLAARIPVIAGVLAGMLTLSPADASAADGITLTASAGAGGVAKADRWTPVRIVVTNEGVSLSGDLQVSWGDVRASRALSLASAGTRTFELYVRTSEPQGTARVRLISGDEEIAAVDAPVRVLAQDEIVTLCVGTPVAAPDAPACSATVDPDALPDSARGYEAVDDVIWSGVDRAGAEVERVDPSLSSEQRAAFDEWREIRRLDRSGDLSLTPQAARPSARTGLPAATARFVAAGVLAYLACLLLAGVALGVRGGSVGRSYGAIAILTIAGVGVALAEGEAGPSRALRLQHATLLQQISGTAGSLLTVRAIAEFPAFTSYALELPLADATIEASYPSGRAAQIFNDDGHPVLSGTYGLGARQGFIAEGVVEVQPLGIAISGGQTRVSNRSSQPLHDCRFGDGFSIANVGTLEPGATIAAEQVDDGIGPLFTCTMTELPVAFREARRAVVAHGLTVVAVYRPAGSAREADRAD